MSSSSNIKNNITPVTPNTGAKHIAVDLSPTVDYEPQEELPEQAPTDTSIPPADYSRLLASTVTKAPDGEVNYGFEVDVPKKDAEPEDPNDPAKIIGKTFAKKYHIEKLIGSGGMAHVYGGKDIESNTPIAIKVMKASSPETIDKRLLRRFIREGETMQNLEHPHILPIYKFGNDLGLQFIAMELLNGGTLRAPKLQLTLQQKLLIVADICDALQYAHQNDIIHRDIKPENMLLSSEQTNDEYEKRPVVKIGDFGLVLIPDASRISRSHDIIGSAYYMSPEQAKGERNLNGLADLYSIGIILYELVTGKVPFEGGGNLLSVLDQQKSATPIAPSEIHIKTLPGLEPLIMTLLLKGPSDRHYQSAQQIAQKIREIISPKKITVEITPPPV